MRDRHKCYGYIADRKRYGCRWLDTPTSETACASCSFYKTEQEYNADQKATEDYLYQKMLKVVTIHRKDGEYYVSVVPDYSIKGGKTK